MKKIIGLVAVMLLIASNAFAAITVTNTIVTGPYADGGNSVKTIGELNLAGTYATGGFTFSPDNCGVSHIQSLMVQGEDGYEFWFNPATGKVLVYQSATVTPAGTVSQPTFTGTPATIPTTVTLTSGTAGEQVWYSNGAFYVTGGGSVALVSDNYTPAGTVSQPTFTGSATTAAPLAEVGAGTSLASVDKVSYSCIGW